MTQNRKLVTEAWKATYPEPIELATGDAVVVGRRDAEWPEFVWCDAETGRSGWVPAAFLDTPEDAEATTTRAYSARELTATAGEPVEVLESAAGWSWCRTPRGTTGWLPDRVLAAP
jgi:hypothetical protein